MAKQNRSIVSLRESTQPIQRVALYARVSTLNNQDPEIQLAELRDYAKIVFLDAEFCRESALF